MCSGCRANLESHTLLPFPAVELPLPLLGVCLPQYLLCGVGSEPVVCFFLPMSNVHLSLRAIYSEGPVGTLSKV